MIGLRPSDPSAERQASDTAQLREELIRRKAERDAIAAEAGDRASELKALLDREIDLLSDTLDTRLTLARIQSSPTSRALEIIRRSKLPLRRIWLAWRGLGRRRRVPGCRASYRCSIGRECRRLLRRKVEWGRRLGSASSSKRTCSRCAEKWLPLRMSDGR